MFQMTIARAGVLAVSAGFASAAIAQDAAVLTFGYTDLNGSYDSGTQVFSANSQALTNGDVTRLVGGTQTAGFDFDAGDIGGASATFNISVDNPTALSLPGIGSVGNAFGAGSFELTDADGDTIVGEIVGSWLRTATGQLFFNALLNNVIITSDDSSFDGVGGTSLNTNLPGGNPFEGTLVVLSFDPNGNFFENSFSDISTQVSARIVPAAPAAGVLGVALGFASRRRR